MGNKMCIPVTKHKRPRKKVLSLPEAAAPQIFVTVRSKKYKRPTFVCDLCVDKKPLHNSFNFKGCTHFYCYDCITNYVVSKLDNNVTSIKCPETECQGVLEWEDCRPILPEAVFDRWGKALCESRISPSKKLYCPFKDCSALMLHEEGDRRFAACPYCDRDICVMCAAPFHNEFSCEEFQRLSKNGDVDAMLTNIAQKKKWKRCPHCKYYVEKSVGCPAIQCRCGHKFCYKCGRSYLGPVPHAQMPSCTCQ